MLCSTPDNMNPELEEAIKGGCTVMKLNLSLNSKIGNLP